MEIKPFPLAQVYRLLEPGPVVLVTTARGKKQNVMTMSWHLMMEFDPPLVGFVLSNRNYTFDLLAATRECVIAVPTVELAAIVVRAGNASGRKTDKFRKFKLTPLPAAAVHAPLIAECYANLECKIIDTTLVEKYNFFIAEVKKAWVADTKKEPRTIHHRGKGVFAVDGKILKLPSRMK